MRCAAVSLAALVALQAPVASADPVEPGAKAATPAPPSPPADLTDAQVRERTDFIVERLEAARWHGEWYYHGWLAVLGAFMAYDVVMVSQRDIDVDDSTRADAVANLIKPMLGVLDVMLMDAPHSRLGADELRGLPAATPEQRRARLASAEAILRRNAEQTDTRFLWFRHVGSVLINLAHGLVIGLAWDDLQTAAISTALGIVGAEALVWTQPWEAADDLEAYQQRFGASAPARAPVDSALRWRIGVLPGGLALTLSF